MVDESLPFATGIKLIVLQALLHREGLHHQDLPMALLLLGQWARQASVDLEHREAHQEVPMVAR